MKTKTESKHFLNRSELCDWIDQMYAEHGKQIVNVSTSACYIGSSLSSNVHYLGYITILQSQEQINID